MSFLLNTFLLFFERYSSIFKGILLPDVIYYSYKVCNIKMMVLLIKLTLNFHSILYALGFALTEHSKYTSSPSLILSAFNVLPSLRETRGRSAK